MRIDLKDVPAEGLAIDQIVKSSQLGFRVDELDLDEAVSIGGRIGPVEERAYRLAGRLSCALRLACVRCLEPLVVPISEELDLLYLPEEANVAQDEEQDRGLSADELAVAFYREDEIDLRQMIWEQIQLAMPMKPLCREDCLGLCAECGGNRNLVACECRGDELDPRWDGLKGLMKR